ncbi:MAG: response regulator transcription factor [Lachnospiraceae bacterium]|nr:response regulator transcription factor [Lachnospiraceae bacterium]
MIYVLEDDNSIREFVVYTLCHTNLEAKGFDKPSLFWAAMDEEKPELILLDIMLPEEDGLSILRNLREDVKTMDIPVIMLTAKDSEYDKVIGLDAGADDYVAKPFGMMELVARIKALLRRSTKKEDTHVIKAGNIVLYVEKHKVLVDGEEISLTLKEYEVLLTLMENKGMVFTRDQLLNKIWGYEFDGESRTVDVHIRTLRSKLKTGGDYIETVRGVGYRIGE